MILKYKRGNSYTILKLKSVNMITVMDHTLTGETSITFFNKNKAITTYNFGKKLNEEQKKHVTQRLINFFRDPSKDKVIDLDEEFKDIIGDENADVQTDKR
ncbi:hypothetical protein [Thermococcus sp.]